ncbi:MAG TPA: hypothetical protein VL461_01210, partial [Dictyobacter sp.]|nr:hypothetical protein [Dictyobacter sp.]
DGLPLLMKTKGSEGFNWIMGNDSITLCVNRSSKMNLLAQVRCSSEYLWKVRDVGQVVSDVQIFVSTVFGQYVVLQPSAIDLAVDLVGFELPPVEQIKECFISRAQMSEEAPASVDTDFFLDGPDKIKRRWGRITGLPFGARAAALSGIIYDKTHEIKYHSPQKAWFHDLWRESARLQGFEWTEDMQVMRVEMRFRRPALREMKQVKQVNEDGVLREEVLFHGIDDAFMLESYLHGLWAYAVGHADGGENGLPDGWLRYVVPSETDVNRSRWSVHPDWNVVQSAFTPPDLSECEYERLEREREELLQEVDAYLEEHPFSDQEKKKRKRKAEKRKFVVPGVDPLLFNLAPYIRERKRSVNMRRMVAQVTGCLSTLEAWRACSAEGPASTGIDADLSETLSVFYRLSEQYMNEKQQDYSEVVHKKRVLYHIAEPVA